MYRWVALIAAVVFVLAMAGAILSSQNSPESKHQPAAEKSEKGDDAKKEKKGLFDRWFPDSTAVFNLFLMIFTGVLAFGGLYQLGLLTRAELISAEAADAAKDAAKATRESVKLSEITSERQLRAYVSIEASEIRNLGPNQAPEGWVRLKNFGSTPAYQMERGGNIMFTAFPAKQFPLAEQIGNPKSVLAPGAHVDFGPIPLPRPLSETEVAAVTNGASAVYVYGEIKYIDAFKQPRTTNFRLFFRGNKTPQYGIVLTAHDEEGNDSD